LQLSGPLRGAGELVAGEQRHLEEHFESVEAGRRASESELDESGQRAGRSAAGSGAVAEPEGP